MGIGMLSQSGQYEYFSWKNNFDTGPLKCHLPTHILTNTFFFRAGTNAQVCNLLTPQMKPVSTIIVFITFFCLDCSLA